jgi:hypothetical protein
MWVLIVFDWSAGLGRSALVFTLAMHYENQVAAVLTGDE